ncbi:MAG: hypothetical protein KBC95_04625, partial [Candidatus Peribacteraceae bacterium]|nr:hypothetical protein [Candidatus Peribacteraceae bacterium]
MRLPIAFRPFAGGLAIFLSLWLALSQGFADVAGASSSSSSSSVMMSSSSSSSMGSPPPGVCAITLPAGQPDYFCASSLAAGTYYTLTGPSTFLVGMDPFTYWQAVSGAETLELVNYGGTLYVVIYDQMGNMCNTYYVNNAYDSSTTTNFPYSPGNSTFTPSYPSYVTVSGNCTGIGPISSSSSSTSSSSSSSSISVSSSSSLSSSSSSGPSCGDSVCNGGEQCDGSSYCAPYDSGCSFFAAPYGSVSCNPDCTVNSSMCQMGICGNGMTDWGVETCDDANGSNFDSCTNACQTAMCGDSYCNGTDDCNNCSADCGFCSSSSSSSVSSSVASTSSSVGPVCGNNSCEYPSESCDGGDYCGANCGSFGFTDGVVTCGMGCVIDTSGCYNGSSSSSVSSSSSSVGSSSSVPAPFFSWWSLPLLGLGCIGAW